MTQRTYPPVGPRKFRFSNKVMTRAEAIAIREAQVAGKPVLALELQEACRVLSKKPEPKKLHLPDLSRPERERVNAVLAHNLGLALGRIQERKALEHPGPDSLLRDFLTCGTCRGMGFVRKTA